jgi:hypothetical protein
MATVRLMADLDRHVIMAAHLTICQFPETALPGGTIWTLAPGNLPPFTAKWRVDVRLIPLCKSLRKESCQSATVSR